MNVRYISFQYKAYVAKEALHNAPRRSKWIASIIYKQRNWFYRENWHMFGPKEVPISSRYNLHEGRYLRSLEWSGRVS